MAHMHKDEIIRFANSPKGTQVWYKYNASAWILIEGPAWSSNTKYIVDDEWAEFRKALLDGKKVFGFKYITGKLFRVLKNHTFHSNNYFIPKNGYEFLYEAVAQGKIIQVNNYGMWEDLNFGVATTLEARPLNEIRIKPEEPVYEWQWLIELPGPYEGFEVSDKFYTKKEDVRVRICGAKVCCKIGESKRERK